jgi:hypothetical protein
MENLSKRSEVPADAILEDWAKERTLSVKDAAHVTKKNGRYHVQKCNSPSIHAHQVHRMGYQTHLHVI